MQIIIIIIEIIAWFVSVAVPGLEGRVNAEEYITVEWVCAHVVQPNNEICDSGRTKGEIKRAYSCTWYGVDQTETYSGPGIELGRDSNCTSLLERLSPGTDVRVDSLERRKNWKKNQRAEIGERRVEKYNCFSFTLGTKKKLRILI